ncbi:glutathione S-transferase family protein [Agrobacterium larrymoorei]|uniref:Glutathione S-transferase family protein n=1 Tax=Agrobacterium larrymoorei TaxID=160699 RepID=A0A4D7DP05_9HYPH|nr:glutathione S-transferase family protein [Agrobacterium larrymoorei]QCI98231.1 glutathione S-transferase family protein [Agrobacterium larrymoorei]QYA06318.1 glutathione S-transferase family protein [Agrobacterium larrymoorei]
MTLKLYLHPLSSFCQKVVVALYENETPFEPVIVDFSDSDSRSALFDRWPLGKIPVLHDTATDVTLPETSIIIEYVHEHYPGTVELLPHNAAEALDVRLWDRFFDLYIHLPMQRIVAERLRPQDCADPHGIAEAYQMIDNAYAVLEQHLTGQEWAGGDEFSLADCSAVPALFYASILRPFSSDSPNLARYFERLMERPSVKRVIAEARPYFQYFPYKERMPPRFLQG